MLTRHFFVNVCIAYFENVFFMLLLLACQRFMMMTSKVIISRNGELLFAALDDLA